MKKTTKANLVVTDVNSVSNMVTLEGYSGDIKLYVMLDYDLKGNASEHTVGDKYMIALGVTQKARAPKKNVVVPKQQSYCKGSGKRATRLIDAKWRYGMHRAICPNCSKEVAVNMDSTHRKHKP